MPVRRPMVVKHALGRVQYVALADAEGLQLRQHVVEISIRWLVGAYVLGGVDRVERDTELLVAGCEALIVDIRQDHQPVVLLQVGERLRRIGKGRPVAHRAPIGEALVPG